MSSHVPGALVPGTTIGGKYRIEREIASGGQGTVFEATHIRLRQKVAIKFPHLRVTQGAQGAERLFREARAAFRVRSAHVARVIDVDIIDDAPFIVMEYLSGVDLKVLLKSRGPLPCAEAVGLVLQACDGVAEAHELGIVHRDLKPSNLFLEDRAEGAPVVKVLDFGLSKTVAPVASSTDELDLTEPLAVLGSPRYMSPEQARDPRQADARSDIWALGLILHELLTGQPAFRAPTKADVLAMVLLKNPTPVSLLRPDLPPGLEGVILRCLQKAPEHRFSSVRNLMIELAPFASPPPVAETSRPATAARPPTRRRAGVAATSAMVAGALLAGWAIRRNERPASAVSAVALPAPPSLAPLPQSMAPPSPPVLAEHVPAPAALPEPPAATPPRARARRRQTREHQHVATAPASPARKKLAIATSSPNDATSIDDPLDGRK